jgi:hypothetical protein
MDAGLVDSLEETGDQLMATEKNLLNSHDQKLRMQRIIEICETNKIQNEEWIRGLNFYLTNLKKAIKFEKEEIKNIDAELDQFNSLNEHFLKNYNLGVTNHENFISIVSGLLGNQKDIDSMIVGTNDKIFRSVDLKKKNLLSHHQKNQEKAENLKMRVLQDKKNEQVSNELEEVKKKFGMVRNIFESQPGQIGEGEDCWYEKPEFKKLLDSLDTRRDLLKYMIMIDEKKNEMDTTMVQFSSENETFKKANRQGKSTDQQLSETSGLSTEVDELGKKLKDINLQLETKSKLRQVHNRNQIKWKMFIQCIMNKVYGDKIDLNAVINSDEINQKLQDQVKFIQGTMDLPAFEKFCEGDMTVVNERLLESNLGPNHPSLYFPGDVGMGFDPDWERNMKSGGAGVGV